MNEEKIMDLGDFRFSGSADITFEDLLAKKYSGASLGAIKKMSRNISHNGLSIEESCLLEGMDYEKFLMHLETEPLLKRLFLIKQLEYKKALMSTLSDKAKEGDKTIATWLAEKKYKDEYGKDSHKTNDDDLLRSALEFVRETTSPDDVIVNAQTRGRTQIIKKTSGSNYKDASHDLNKYLG